MKIIKVKTIYQSDDGTNFDSEQECLDYENKNALLTHIMSNMSYTYNDDAGFSIIEETDIEAYIKTHINKINEIINM